jgi:hypothetical protein
VAAEGDGRSARVRRAPREKKAEDAGKERGKGRGRRGVVWAAPGGHLGDQGGK